jgi:hypothetical protein
VAEATTTTVLDPPPRGGGTRLRLIRPTRYRLVITVVLALALGFYLWTAATSVPFTFPSESGDVYNELTTSFLHGHTYLPITPPSGLLHLADPYNPVQNAPYNLQFHDLALYGRHFYSAWGPTPVLTLFAPFRITGLVMSESFAAALYAFVGLVCAVLLLEALVARLLPRTPKWVLVVSSVGLALTNALPFLLRRPLQYEVAVSCGYCFEMAGLWLTVTAVLSPHMRPRRMALGSFCLGLAVGGRPTMVLGGAVALAAALWEIRRRHGSYRVRRAEGSYRVLLYALGPFVICGILLLLYNEVRFHSPTNFGDRYQLANIDQTKAKFFSLSYIVPGLLSYLLVPARLALTFPHAFLQTAAADPITLPANYLGSPRYPLPAEPAGGVLTTMPITLLLLGLPVLWRSKQSSERRVLFAATGLAVLGLLIATMLAWSVFGTTQRYEVDFASLLLIPALLIWALILDRYRPGATLRRVWAVLGVALILFGALVGTAVSFTGYSDLLREEHPGVFDTLEDVTGPVATLATMIRGKPELARIDNGPLSAGQVPTGVTDAGGSAWLGRYPITFVVLSPGSRWIGITATLTAGPDAPKSAQRIRVSTAGRQLFTRRIAVGGVRLPIFVHWGLNRIRVNLMGRPSADQEFQLGNLQVSS